MIRRMPWIEPLDETAAPDGSRATADAHAATGGRMTNMKWTLAHAPAALDALLQWYPLHDASSPFLGERRTDLFCHAISTQSDCLICSTFFRRHPDRRGRGSRRARARRVRRADRRLRPPPGHRPARGRRRAPRAARRALRRRGDRPADRVRGDHGRDQRLQRRARRAARRLPRAVPRRRGVTASRFITGAAHGQGRATALALAEDGYDIVALDVAAPLAVPRLRDGHAGRARVAARESRCSAALPDARRRRARRRGRRGGRRRPRSSASAASTCSSTTPASAPTASPTS